MARKESVRRLARRLAASLMLGALAAPAASAQSADSALTGHPATVSTHVHLLNDVFDARPLLKSAVEKSPTVRRLVEALNGGDVIVYLALRDDVPSGSGDLHFMSAAPA